MHTFSPFRTPGALSTAIDVFAILLVGLTAGSSAGCMMRPTDGTAVSSTGATVQFEGYLNKAPGHAVAVEARNPATGAFTQIGPTTRTSALVTSLWDTEWHHWSVSTPIPSQFWQPGSRGATAVVRARALGETPTTLYGSNERFFPCLSQSTTLNEFAADCTEPGEITVCTSDFLPFSSRRGPCPRRAVLERRGNQTEVFHRLPDRTTTMTVAGGLSSIGYRGDPVSFIDVFDEVAGPDGFPLGGANVVRIRYARSRTSSALDDFDPAALAGALGTAPGLPWRGARTIRQYDVGECGEFVSWRTLIRSTDPTTGRETGIVPALELAVQTASRDSRLIPTATRTAIRPLLRPDGRDGVSVSARFFVESRDHTLQWLRIGYVIVRANVVFGTTTRGAFVASLEPDSIFDLTVTNSGAAWLLLGGRSEQSVEAEIRQGFVTSIGSAVAGLLPPSLALVGVDRVHCRPDGLELVLAESTRENDFTLLSPTGRCNRPDPTGGGNQSGLLFTFFDPPLSSDPVPFGDTAR